MVAFASTIRPNPTYTVELLFGSTAMESVEPIRSCPNVGAFDQGDRDLLDDQPPGQFVRWIFQSLKRFGGQLLRRHPEQRLRRWWRRSR